MVEFGQGRQRVDMGGERVSVMDAEVRHGSPSAPHLVPNGEKHCRVCGKNVMLETFTKEGNTDAQLRYRR